MRLILPSGESIELTEEFIDKIFPREILGTRESNLNYFQVIFNRFHNEKFSSENISLQFIAFIIHQINEMHDAWVRGDRKAHGFIGEKDIRNLQKLVLVACREYFSSETVIVPSETILCDYLGIKIHYYGRPPNELSFDSCLPANLHFIIDKQLLSGSFVQENKIFTEIESKLEKIGAFYFSFESSERGRFCISGITVPEMNRQLIERGFDIVGPHKESLKLKHEKQQEILNLLVLNGICDESLKNKVRFLENGEISTDIEFSKETPFSEVEGYAIELGKIGLFCSVTGKIFPPCVIHITLSLEELIPHLQKKYSVNQKKHVALDHDEIISALQRNFSLLPIDSIRLYGNSILDDLESGKLRKKKQNILDQLFLSGIFPESLKNKIHVSDSLNIIGKTSLEFSKEIPFFEIENYAVKLRGAGLNCEAYEGILENGIRITLTIDALISWFQNRPFGSQEKEENSPSIPIL